MRRNGRSSLCVHAGGATVRQMQGVDTVLGKLDGLLITIPEARSAAVITYKKISK